MSRRTGCPTRPQALERCGEVAPLLAVDAQLSAHDLRARAGASSLSSEVDHFRSSRGHVVDRDFCSHENSALSPRLRTTTCVGPTVTVGFGLPSEHCRPRVVGRRAEQRDARGRKKKGTLAWNAPDGSINLSSSRRRTRPPARTREWLRGVADGTRLGSDGGCGRREARASPVLEHVFVSFGA
jgi:hypothetical protein